MKAVKSNTKVVVLCDAVPEIGFYATVVRARVLRGGRGRIRFRVNHTTFVAATAQFTDEGITWARGWDTEAARALYAVAALM